MTCARIRQSLMQPDGRQPAAAHLRRCAACRSFAERLQTTRQGLRRHHAGIEPDAAFAARVGRQLANDTPTYVGRTALHLLPLSAAVLLLLFLISTQTTPTVEPAATITTTEDAYVTWVLAADEENS